MKQSVKNKLKSYFGSASGIGEFTVDDELNTDD